MPAAPIPPCSPMSEVSEAAAIDTWGLCCIPYMAGHGGQDPKRWALGGQDPFHSGSRSSCVMYSCVTGVTNASKEPGYLAIFRTVISSSSTNLRPPLAYWLDPSGRDLSPLHAATFLALLPLAHLSPPSPSPARLPSFRSVNYDPFKQVAAVRSLLYPGYTFYYAGHEATWGALYAGDGTRNNDLLFML